MTSILPSLPASNISNFQADTKTAVDSSVTPFDSVLEKQMAATDQSPKQDNVKKTTSKPDSKATDNDNEKEDENQTDKPQTAAQPDLLNFIMSAQDLSTTKSTDNEDIKNAKPETLEQPGLLSFDISTQNLLAQNTNTAISKTPVEADISKQSNVSAGKNQMPDLTAFNADKIAEKLLSADQLAQAKTAISDMANQQTTEDFGNQPSLNPTPATPAAVSTALPTTPTVATTPIYQVAPSLNQSGWDQAISQRVVWMANQQLQNATITINPEHLGPIQVQVQVQIDSQQQASVQFISAQPEVRQALQNAIPTLSNMLEQSGIQLGHSDVSSQGSDSNDQQQGKANPFQGSETVIDNSLIDLPTSSSSGQGLINVSA
jgi:flagellar hook-length control protein FliK